MLWTSVAELDKRDQVKAFLKDLLSESEAIMLARRIKIARRLLEGVGYDEIQKELKTGRSTIANVDRWLTSGFKGYETAIKKFTAVVEHRLKEAKSKKAEPYSFEWLKRKYPLHFLLFNLIDKTKS